MKVSLSLLFCIFLSGWLYGQNSGGRITHDLSANDWFIHLDTAAKWENDVLFLPPVNVDTLPVNVPTGGWESLQEGSSKKAHLPATVEQYFWGMNGNAFGVTGNYLGVSWFSTQVFVPEAYKGKRITLHFESVRLRAEVYVNRKLIGYDLINSTPFDVDITDAVIPGRKNDISVRITDPNGNFDWRDSKNFMWGDYRVQPSHGFGGITGKVLLVATDQVYIDDIYVQNQPRPHDIHVQVTANNITGHTAEGRYHITVTDPVTKQVCYQKYQDKSLHHGLNQDLFSLSLPKAELWSPDHPHLYRLQVEWQGKDNTQDTCSRRFGLRWFEVRDNKGDQQFWLNGKRIVLRTAISWGFWPKNGITPSDELARKQVLAAKALGLNMLNFHRAIGQSNVLDAADELGLLYFEEPGGNSYPAELFKPRNPLEQKQTSFYLSFRQQKLDRMILRDRSHPSLVIYNMHNERGALPQAEDSMEMRAGHQLDPSRIMTYNSCNGNIKVDEPDPKFKLHLLPFDTTFYSYGWFDQHHAGGPGTYHDHLYNNPRNYAKYTDHKDEIVYYGEEGAIGTPPRLQLIKEAIVRDSSFSDWQSQDLLRWFNAYDNFLDGHPGFKKAFPNVDSLTRKMGNVAYYYQGRIIENARLNNTIDGYAINGWESMKLENHSGIVDNYRNFKGDPELIAKYNQPLYIAVKLRNKVLGMYDSAIADLFIVNEKNLHGIYTLSLTAATEGAESYFTWNGKVKVRGGSCYGQLLAEHVSIPVTQEGNTTITVSLSRGNALVCTGTDEFLAVSEDTTGVNRSLVVADTSGIIAHYLKSVGIKKFNEYTHGTPDGDLMIVGQADPQQMGNPLVTDILEWVNNGHTLVVVANTEAWATYLHQKEVLDYRGMQVLGKSWYGGNFFVKESDLFSGLPQACVFNWPYQCFATYNKDRKGMRLGNGETVVACVSDHKPEVYSALSIIRQGRGRIVLTTLDIMSCLRKTEIKKMKEGDGENASMQTMDTSEKNPANIVGRRLLLNLLKLK